jgi:hypothetical protein
LFRLACGCRTCDTWSSDVARGWWERHLPELTGPLTYGEPDTVVSRTAAAAVN